MATLGAQNTTCKRNSLRPFVWADITASDDENEEVAVLPALPVVDESYREGPLANLENSCDGLNRGVRDLAAPKAFKFPFQATDEAENVPKSNISSPKSTWQPNLHAPEFIPTMSMACPLVGFCHMVPEDVGTPEKGADPLHTFGAERRRKGLAGRKRQPSALQVPAKRSKSEERHVVPAVLGQSQMPAASEEEWQHRISMRKKAVSVGKETPEYKWFAESKNRDAQELEEPMTPDPTDRKVSKRHWKYAVQLWRTALKQRYLEEGGRCSVVSTEEWQSTSAATTEEPEGTATIDGDNDSNA